MNVTAVSTFVCSLCKHNVDVLEGWWEVQRWFKGGPGQSRRYCNGCWESWT